ncbi:Membrane protein insertase YidC [uncultured delta proteobacterium]|uniref:Membrane protein insertase YidC n=1 Tax=uncultured delta proteobacterium TaxID=34034 RepID=A0A212IWL9_9DELT|nr:Membrane protein insertase YidC [uncultured delta proteobacterium]
MDMRRTIMAIAASFVILLSWQQLSVYMGWTPDPALQPAPQQQAQPAQDGQAGGQAGGQVSEGQPQTQASAPVAPLPAFQPAPGRDVVVETPLYKAVFYSGGGILREFSLKTYRMGLEPDSPVLQMISPEAAAKAPMGIILDGAPSWSGTSWSLEGGDLNLKAGETGTLTFVGEVNGVRLARVLAFDASKFSIKETVKLQSEQPRSLRLAFTMSTGKLSQGGDYDLTRVAYLEDDSFKSAESEKDLSAGLTPSGNFSWAGIMSNYFLAAVTPTDTNTTLKIKLENGAYRVAVEKTGITVGPAQTASLDASYYIGPKEQGILNAEPGDLGKAINYGFFSIVARPLIAMLHFFYGFAGNWGVAIILLTLVIKIILWPLSYKSYKSMEQMKKLQPMMAKLKEKHGDDKETMNREMMQLYKTYKVNPASGCLPILVQIPVFIGLYQGLLGSIQLRHASFIPHIPFTDYVWLADLSVKDPYYITPIVMGLTMLLQQKLTPAAGDPMQQKIMMIMPVVFTFFFLNFPSGLVVYWLANNVISIAQQWWQLRRVK